MDERLQAKHSSHYFTYDYGAHLFVPILRSVHQCSRTLVVLVIDVTFRLEQFAGDLLEMV